MTKEQLVQFISRCTSNHDLTPFYVCGDWKRLRAKVLTDDKHECQRCRIKYHRYRKATTVHHRNTVINRPDLALTEWYTGVDSKRHRNLVSLCDECHAEVHGYWRKDHGQPITMERWD